MPKFDSETLFEWFAVICICVLMGTCTYSAAKKINQADVKEQVK